MRNKLIVWMCLEKKERGNVSMKSRYDKEKMIIIIIIIIIIIKW